MWINDKSLCEYGGFLTTGYKVSGCELDVTVLQGRNRTSLGLLHASPGLKKLTVPIVFRGRSSEDVSCKKSMFEQLIFGKNELIMEDGLLYTAVLSSIGNAEFIGTKAIKTEYVFTAVRHGNYVKKNGNTVYCDSTLPYTDCILTVTVSKDSTNYKVGSVTFENVTAGEVLTVDGINGRILVNGTPAAERADWIEFPKLVPGENTIQCDDELTVEFYPAYF